MSVEVLAPHSATMPQSNTRPTDERLSHNPAELKLNSPREPTDDTQAADERVQRSTGLQFPFLSAFFRRNLESSQKPLMRTDSLDSADTHIHRQRSVDSADQQVGRGARQALAVATLGRNTSCRKLIELYLCTTGLKVLDLRALPRDDGPPTELQARREKFAFFEKECSEVADGICVSGEVVARDRALLQRSGITHIINCIGMLCPACFPGDFTYMTLCLNDATGEDMVSLLYDVFRFIEEAADSGGKVLVHCSQGVSRSATFVIAYLMWKHSWSYDQAYQKVKAIRGVTNPNIGFTCQLLNWAKRRGAPTSGCKLYHVLPHSLDNKNPAHLVARHLRNDVSVADSSKVMLIWLPTSLFIWQGSHSAAEHLRAAWKAAAQLQKYENAPAAVLVQQGSETEELGKILGLGPEAQQESLDLAVEHVKPPHVPKG